MKRNFSGAGLTVLTALLLVGRNPELVAAEPTPLDTFDARAGLVMDAALTDVAKLNGGSPMHFWIAQRLFEQGEKERALAIVKSGDTRVNGQRVAYETWPLLENPWMRQEYGSNLTVTDGKTSRVYDVTNWTIIEETRP